MAAYVSASALSAAAVGGVLGWSGYFLSFGTRIALASLFSVVAMITGVLEFTGARMRLLQCNVETPQEWVRQGSLPWAFKNGSALGVGAVSRIGFPLWYVVPLGSILLASPRVGAALYGAYGLARALPACAMFWIEHHYAINLGPFSDALLRENARVRRYVAGYLLALGLAIATAVGL